MPSKMSLNRKNSGSCSIATCNADKKRYTVGATVIQLILNLRQFALEVAASGDKLKLQILFRRQTMPKELDERPDDNIDVWVASKSNTTDETMADLVPYLFEVTVIN